MKTKLYLTRISSKTACLFLLFPAFLQARTLASSGNSLNFNDKNAWIDLATGVAPVSPPKVGSASYDDIIISHDLTYTGSLDFKGGSSLLVNEIGSLTLSGDLKAGTWGVGNNIINKGEITVGGDVVLSSPSSFSNTGIIRAVNFTLSTGNSHSNSGDLQLSGAFLHNGAGTFTSAGGNIVAGTNFTVGSATATADISGTNITVGANLATIGSGRMLLSGDSEVNVGGNFTSSGSVATIFSGEVNVTGSVLHSGSSALTFNGASNIGGDFTATGPSPVSVSGNLSITGALTMNTGGNITGDGVVGWGSLAVDGSSGTTYIACVSGDRFDSSPGWPNQDAPPANPLSLSSCAVAALDVELLHAALTCDRGSVTLDWVVGSEEVVYYEVMSSADGVYFESVAKVKASNDSERQANYQVRDLHPDKYYRLLEVDFHGNRKALFLGKTPCKNSVDAVTIYPNPALSHWTLEVHENRINQFEIVDAGGRVILSKSLGEGVPEIHRIDASNFSAGYYLLKYFQGGELLGVKKLIKN